MNRPAPTRPPAVDDTARRRFKRLAKSRLWELLAAAAELGTAARGRIAVGDDAGRLTLTLGDDGAATGGQFPGLHFSPIESAVWHALAGGPLSAKGVAKAIGQKCSPKLRTILHNLRERRVVTYDAASGGYSRPPAAARKGDGHAS